jgi:hypothetical protein
MRIYRCKTQYLSGLRGEPIPCWPQDSAEPEEMPQARLTGTDALEWAFDLCRSERRDMEVGDVVGLDDGTLWRCEAEGWADIGKIWTARVQNSRERARHAAQEG